MKPIINTFILLLLILFQSNPSHAHNGTVAIAVPVVGIVADGDLSDWPEGMKEYPIERCESGVAPLDSYDFQGFFRIGFNEEENALYVAIEVQDESVVVDSTIVADWNNQDGCEFYLDIGHGEINSPGYKYDLWGTSHQVNKEGGSWQLEIKRKEKSHQYEWRIGIEGMDGIQKRLHAGIALALDVVILDKDDDGSFSWMAWGAGGNKWFPDTRGDVVLVRRSGNLGTIKGRVAWEDPSEDIPPRKVRLQSMASEELWIQVNVDQQGRYSAEVPEGSYEINTVDMRLGQKRGKIITMDAVKGKVREASILKVTPEKKSVLLEEYMKTAVQDENFSGSVIVTREGKMLLKEGYGLASIELGVANTPQTKFRIGSVTKQFTAMGIMILEERGELSVDDTIAQYLPAVPESWKGITIHHLLTHTSGLTHPWVLPGFWDKIMMVPVALEENIGRYKEEPLLFEPGEKYQYSGLGYFILASIIENISGQTYEAFLQDEIFDPLGMKDTGADHSLKILPHRASGYSRGGEDWTNAAHIYMPILTGGGNLYSTVEDFSRWDRALSAHQLISEESYRKMYTPFKAGYAYGWGVGEGSGRTSYAHGGGINGFSAYILRYPEPEICIVVLSNIERAPVYKITDDLAAIVFGGRS